MAATSMAVEMLKLLLLLLLLLLLEGTGGCQLGTRNPNLKGTRWKNLSRHVHGEVVLRQYSEHKAEQQEQEQYKEPHEEPMLTSPL